MPQFSPVSWVFIFIFVWVSYSVFFSFVWWGSYSAFLNLSSKVYLKISLLW